MCLFRRYMWVVLLAGAVSCTGSQSASDNATAMGGSPDAARLVVVDVPALVGRNIDQVRQVLGTPRETKEQKVGPEPTPEQLKSTKGEDWVNTFEHKGTTIVATFNARTRKVRDLVVIGADEDEVLEKANLSLTATNYLILPVVNPKNDRELIGMRVVPKL